MLNLVLIKVLFGLLVFSLVVFGLTAHAFSLRLRRFYNSSAMRIYASLVIVIFTYFYVGDVLNEFLTQQFDIKNAAKLYSQMNIIACIVNYFTAMLLSRTLVHFFNNISLFETLNYLHVSAELTKPYVKVVGIKVVLFPSIVELTLLLQQLRNDPERHLLWTLYTLLPMVISQLLPNCLFGAMVSCKMLTDALNASLAEIVKEVNCLQTAEQMKLQKSYYRMQRFCDLADKLDVLAQKYHIICTQMDAYLQLMSVPFVCSLLCNLCGITAGFFTQYLAIADTLVNDEHYDVFNALTNAIFLAISMSDIILQAHICDGNRTAVQETGVILQRVTLVHADVRFKQSVEAFSLLILVTKYKIQPLRMLEVNISLVHDVLSAVTSFLLILIQSDLTLRFSLK